MLGFALNVPNLQSSRSVDASKLLRINSLLFYPPTPPKNGFISAHTWPLELSARVILPLALLTFNCGPASRASGGGSVCCVPWTSYTTQEPIDGPTARFGELTRVSRSN